jgi:hypothetical protein
MSKPQMKDNTNTEEDEELENSSDASSDEMDGIETNTNKTEERLARTTRQVGIKSETSRGKGCNLNLHIERTLFNIIVDIIFVLTNYLPVLYGNFTEQANTENSGNSTRNSLFRKQDTVKRSAIYFSQILLYSETSKKLIEKVLEGIEKVVKDEKDANKVCKK